MAFALYRVGIDAPRLAADPDTMRLMVLATQRRSPRSTRPGTTRSPRPCAPLYRLPTVLVTAYWRRVLNGPRGELWFGAHSRDAPEEMYALAGDLREAMRHTGRPTPNLERLLAIPT